MNERNAWMALANSLVTWLYEVPLEANLPVQQNKKMLWKKKIFRVWVKMMSCRKPLKMGMNRQGYTSRGDSSHHYSTWFSTLIRLSLHFSWILPPLHHSKAIFLFCSFFSVLSYSPFIFFCKPIMAIRFGTRLEDVIVKDLVWASTLPH